MPSLPLFIDENDLPQLLEILNNDAEIAFIVSAGPKKWISQKQVSSISDGPHLLWHWLTDPLPLLPEKPAFHLPDVKELTREDLTIERMFPAAEVPDPWSGWTELRTGGDPRVPFFGNPPNVIHWHVGTRAVRGNGIGMSTFGWIGNHYSILGSRADKQTERWWRRLRRVVKQRAVPIPSSGPVDGPRPDVWAFPSALKRIRSGVHRDDHPW